MFLNATQVGNQTRVKAMKTSTGTKDTYLESFLDRMSSAFKRKHGLSEKQKALDDVIASLPGNIISPVWRIKGSILAFDSACA